MPVLDVTELSATQLDRAVDLFDAMSKMDLLPIHEIAKDPVRQELDQEFARNVLGLPGPMLTPGGALELLRRKLALEPSIRGQKA